MYAKGVQIYIAPTADPRDTWLASMRHIAAEGRCFVLSCNQYTTKDMFPPDIASREEFANLPNEMSRGGSCIVDPLGNFLAKPVFGKEEIIYGDIDLNRIAEAQFDFDVVGHYARPDVFQLVVNEKKQENVIGNEE